MHVIAEGKTKRVVPIRAARFISKNDLTAGDGAKHDVLLGKGALANRTTSNVFGLLNECGVDTSFLVQDSETSFIGLVLDMIPIEVVVRGEAHGSYLKRNPGIEKGHRFDELIVEMYLKSKDRQFKGHRLECDDPMMLLEGDTVYLLRPDLPVADQKPFLELPLREVFEGLMHTEDEMRQTLEMMADSAAEVFAILRMAWDMLGKRLADMKTEYGIYPDESSGLMLGDVIDNDSWRLLDQSEYLDKQVYRDGGDLKRVLDNYRRVADLTDQFVDTVAFVRAYKHIEFEVEYAFRKSA